jgi:HSP20 family protein
MTKMSKLIPAQLKETVGQLREGVAEAFDRFLPDRWKGEQTLAQPSSLASIATLFAQGGPAVDVYEDAEAVHINAELPGLQENDFSVELQGGNLVIRGEKRASIVSNERDCHYSECSYGSFTRRIHLPCEINEDQVAATFKNGVLSVTLPKPENAIARKVQVTVL